MFVTTYGLLDKAARSNGGLNRSKLSNGCQSRSHARVIHDLFKERTSVLVPLEISKVDVNGFTKLFSQSFCLLQVKQTLPFLPIIKAANHVVIRDS